MVTLAYSRAGWSALWVETHATEPDIALRINGLLMLDRSAYPALSVPAPIADILTYAYAAMDSRRRK